MAVIFLHKRDTLDELTLKKACCCEEGIANISYGPDCRVGNVAGAGLQYHLQSQ